MSPKHGLVFRADGPSGRGEYLGECIMVGRDVVAGSVKVSLVVPTRNEAENIQLLVDRIMAQSGSDIGEILFVDDSTDRTPEVIQSVRQDSTIPIRLIHRPQAERVNGLGGAVLRGMRAADHDWVGVMDADLQHPPELLPEMIRIAAEQNCSLVIASRRLPDGVDAGLSALRKAGSDGATALAKTIFPKKLASVTDPLSGYFLVDRSAVSMDALRPNGFKILLELLVRSPELSIAEVPFEFGERHAGKTKASTREALRYLRLLGALRAAPNAKPPTLENGYYYSIHGIIDVCSDVSLPELAKFRTESRAKRADINVSIGDPAPSSGDRSVFYAEIPRGLGFATRISKTDVTNIVASPLVGYSPHVLYTNVVEPVLRWAFVERDYALVHAACVEVDGDAYFVTAKTDTGKTTTTLKLLESGNYRFISDDLSLIDSSGVVLTYPKPMTVSRHTLDALQSARLTTKQSVTLPIQSRLHSRSGRRAGLSLAKTRLPAATMNAVVQKLIPPPKFHVEQLVQGAKLTAAAKVAALFVITRGEDQKRVLTESEAIELLVENSADAYGFPPYPDIEPFLRAHRGADLAVAEREIIAAAFADRPAWLIGSRTMGWADDIAFLIEEERRSPTEGPGHQGAKTDEPGMVVDITDANLRIVDDASPRSASQER